ncbi:MAG: tetratricopeptide repeat protein [Candidatus Methanoperedens sp.]|nr:tetratricopeptide repeat protein [Candidatus Methanoperedens sp.]
MRWNIGEKILGYYEILKVHEGGMGIVYVVWDHRWKMYSAIKTLKDEIFWDDEAIKRFRKEADTWVNLEKHTNIVFAIITIIIDGKPHILLEYIEGGNLAQLVGKLNIFELFDFAIQFCDGMDYAYSKLGIIHRDIKPGNILISKCNNKRIYKTTDFGLVAILEDAYQEKKLKILSEQVSHGIGTWPYMPPEQFPGKFLNRYSFNPKPITTRSDIYSFGVTLYEVSTGRRPFSNLDEIFKTDPVNPKLINQTIPYQLDKLIMRCLEKNPDERPRNFKELRDELIEMHRNIFTDDYIIIGKKEELDEVDWLNKGFSYGQLEQFEDALRCFDIMLTKNGQNAKALSGKGTSLLMLNRVEEALVYIDQALKIEPNDNIILNAKAACLIKANRYEDALEYLDKGLQRPFDQLNYLLERVPLLTNKSVCLLRLGKYQPALDCINEALRLYPRSTECLINIGIILSDLGRFNDAIESFEKVISMDPKNADAWLQRGYASHLLGSQDKNMFRFENAIKSFDKVLEINHTGAEAWIGKGIALYVLDKDKEAKKCFENALSFSRDEEIVETARKYLEKIR